MWHPLRCGPLGGSANAVQSGLYASSAACCVLRAACCVLRAVCCVLKLASVIIRRCCPYGQLCPTRMSRLHGSKVGGCALHRPHVKRDAAAIATVDPHEQTRSCFDVEAARLHHWKRVLQCPCVEQDTTAATDVAAPDALSKVHAANVETARWTCVWNALEAGRWCLLENCTDATSHSCPVQDWHSALTKLTCAAAPDAYVLPTDGAHATLIKLHASTTGSSVQANCHMSKCMLLCCSLLPF